MSIADYIREIFHTDETLPFETFAASYKKGDIITAINQMETNAYFLKEGVVQVAADKDGEEKIIDFFYPPNFVCSYSSFLSGTPSDVEICCLTDVVVEIVPLNKLLVAYEHSLIANKLGRYVTEHFFLVKTRREKDFLLKSAEERYRELMQNRPELIEQIPVHKIAKYLGIHPESLSRIRKNIIS